MTKETIILAILWAVLITMVYRIGVISGRGKAIRAIEPREMFPVMDKIADEISKDEADKYKMSIAMLRILKEILTRL